MIGQQLLKRLTAVLAALIRVVEQRVRFAAALDRHHQRIRDQRGTHRGTHRPADHTAREQVDDSRHVEPAFGRSDVGEIGEGLSGISCLGDQLGRKDPAHAAPQTPCYSGCPA
jgi:hypothetical protein